MILMTVGISPGGDGHRPFPFLLAQKLAQPANSQRYSVGSVMTNEAARESHSGQMLERFIDSVMTGKAPAARVSLGDRCNHLQRPLTLWPTLRVVAKC